MTGTARVGVSDPAEQATGAGRPERRPGRILRSPEVLVTALALALFSWRLGRPSPWWDEAITRDVVARPAARIVDLLSSIDLVHGAYYLLVHALVGPDPTFTTIRAVSVVAAAGTATLLVRIGRELDSVQVGSTAALLWVAAPLTSRYAQEARSYALVALAATAATLALLRLCNRPWATSRWLLYVGCLVAVGLFNVLGLLLLPAHLMYVLATASRRVRLRWPVAAGAALLLLAPLLLAASGQRGQVSWLPRPALDQLTGFFDAQFTQGWVVLALLSLAVAGVARGGTHRAALGLGLAWAVLPPVALWTVSQLNPLYDWRYVFFAVPGTALALASLAPLLRPPGTLVLVLALALTGVHMQQVYRWPATGHAEDVRGAAELVGAGARPGDAVVFLPSSRRIVALGYPEEFRAVDDIALARDPVGSATLWGVEGTGERIAAALRGHERVWVVTGPPRLGESAQPAEVAKERLVESGYRLVQETPKRKFTVRLYLKRQ